MGECRYGNIEKGHRIKMNYGKLRAELAIANAVVFWQLAELTEETSDQRDRIMSMENDVCRKISNTIQILLWSLMEILTITLPLIMTKRFLSISRNYKKQPECRGVRHDKKHVTDSETKSV